MTNVRKTMGLVAAVPALVLALAQPSDAASNGVVAFAGTLQITPRAVEQQVTTAVCFFGPAKTCANGAESSGAAAGTALDALGQSARAVDGLQVAATYAETCAAGTGLSPVGSAQLTGKVHDAVTGAWSQDVRATWTRAGLVAVISGDATGAALFTPAGVPACGAPMPVAVTGAVELAY
jgi:hypothetical protein